MDNGELIIAGSGADETALREPGKAVVILGRPEFGRLIGAIVEENLRDARTVSDEG